MFATRIQQLSELGFQLRLVKHSLQFIVPSGTSRGVMTERPGLFLVFETEGRVAHGECGPLAGLSTESYEELLFAADAFKRAYDFGRFEDAETQLNAIASLKFGFEMAHLDAISAVPKRLFDTAFSRGTASIQINGLIWMGSPDFMKKQISEKLDDGFKCLKLKVGSNDFAEECSILQDIRSHFSPEVLEIRLDANGAFSAESASEKLKRLSDFHIHSIEQPVQPVEIETLASLSQEGNVAVALDESLIGVREENRSLLLQSIQPQYIILKPTLLGGFSDCDDWIEKATENHINWWATSALESNIGLNAIAQWASTKTTSMPQGLGTGKIYSNNFASPLFLVGERLSYVPANAWEIDI